ncbi:unnamed protein product [Pleuronectes platessa]|uniref:RNA-binding S4 domain-containing protein n=1 Tax=Pleuronectes platessa TaxID=8262 RepID=A0A9N7V902_PLEPL|nr:unnamed protein product [Pleuronectes platessa]
MVNGVQGPTASYSQLQCKEPSDFRHLAQRRRSAPSLVFGKALGMPWSPIRDILVRGRYRVDGVTCRTTDPDVPVGDSHRGGSGKRAMTKTGFTILQSKQVVLVVYTSLVERFRDT